MKTTLLLSVFAFILFTSCRERIDIELNNASSRIVIEGVFTNENKQHEVRITRSSGYLDGNSTPAVTDATVSISDGTNVFNLTHTGNGVYASDSGVAGIPGHTYYLNVSVDGDEYTASETMNPITPLDSIAILRGYLPIQPGVILEGDKEYYNIGVFCQEPANETNFYLFDVYRNGELFTDTITKKFCSDDGFINGSYIYGMNVMQIDGHQGDTVKLVMSSISRGFYNFIYGLLQAGMSCNPFAGQPSNIDNNLSGGALGYFRVSAVTSYEGIIK